MDQQQLDAILYRHYKWQRGMAGGERADLSRADLSDANLSRADLSRADLSDANLSRADLSRADLSRADLSRADLSDANLSRADLSDAKEDLFEILNSAPDEVPGLLKALKDGHIDGTSYSGECACLVGTIAKVRGCSVHVLEGIEPNSSRPAEKWFLAIRQFDTPENSQVAKITSGWIEEWLTTYVAVTADAE